MTTATPHLLTSAPATTAFAALDHDFELVCDDAALADHLRSVLGELRTAGGSTHRYELRVKGGAAVLTFDDDVVCIDTNASRAVAMLFWHINREAVARSRRLVRLHAGGVVGPAGGVLLPGAMESGKSTLTAALVRAGFGYLSDEVVAIDTRTGWIEGFPRAISLDPGSWPAFSELRPRVSEPTSRLLPCQWQVPPADLRPRCVERRARPAFIVAPRLSLGAPLTVERMEPVETLRLLVSATFDVDANAPRDLRVLGELTRSCPSFAVTFSDVEPAVSAVRDVLSRKERP